MATAAFAQDGAIVGTVRDALTKAPLSGVTVETNDPVSARTTLTGADGRFRLDHLAPPDTQWAGQVIVNVRSAVFGVASRDFTVTSEEFTIDELPPGRWMVQVESNAVTRPEYEKLFVKAARFGTLNALGESLSVTESGNPPLEIQLSPDAGRVVGTVVDEDGMPRKRTLILVFRATAKSVFGRAPATGWSKDDGSFVIDGLAPGSYRLLVVNDGRAPALHARDVVVEVKAGETAVVRLRP